MSRRIASELGDQQYFAASGSLSDYEARDSPPRHVHKAFTLCAVYGLHFSTFLKVIGLNVGEAGTNPIPDNLLPRQFPADFRRRTSDISEPAANGLLERLLSRSKHVPFFLRGCLTGLSGLSSFSLNDFFWVGGDQSPLHPLLVNGLIAIVNRHTKKPLHLRSKPLWQQPLYVLLRRDGTYVCGCCSLEDGTLMLHPYSVSHQRPEHLQNHRDAEVIGQIVTVARRL